MACATGVKPLKKKNKKENVIENSNPEEKTMSTTMVRQEMPEFEIDAYDAKTGHYITVSNKDYKDKWAVICFYPADFTFVCPTEIAAMNAHYDEFQKMGVEILAYISVGLITIGWLIALFFDTGSKVKKKLEEKNREDQSE